MNRVSCLHAHEVEQSNQTAFFTQNSDHLTFAGATDAGGREENQDCFGYSQTPDGISVFAVADGLGGHQGGRVASNIAIQAVNHFFNSPDYIEQWSFDKPNTLVNCFDYVQQQLNIRQKEHSELASMRTTLVIALIRGNSALWAHIGDVRLYHFSKNYYFRTIDDSVPQMMLELGEIKEAQIRSHPDRSRLLRALGKQDDAIKISYTPAPRILRQGDLLQLSSDGFWESLDEQQMQQHYKMLSQGASLQQVTTAMLQSAKAVAQQNESEYDNLTVFNIMLVTQQSDYSKQASYTTCISPKTFFKLK